MEISFVIPALNESQLIGSTLDSIHENCRGRFRYEVIVADHGSSDGTVRIATSNSAVVIHPSTKTIAGLRNAGVKHSSGEILVFLDADVTLSSNWGEEMREVIGKLRESPLTLTGSRTLPASGNDFFHRHWHTKSSTGTLRHIGTPHMIMHRDLFQIVGGFDETLKTGEDYDICARAQQSGASLFPNDRLIATQNRLPSSVQEFIRRERWHGLSDAASISRVVRSRVALMTIAFIMIHIGMIYSILSPSLFALSIFFILLAAHLYVSVRKKKGKQKITRIIAGMAIFYLYYTGRSLSFLPAREKRWMD